VAAPEDAATCPFSRSRGQARRDLSAGQPSNQEDPLPAVPQLPDAIDQLVAVQPIDGDRGFVSGQGANNANARSRSSL
jgi:hypothetical protein